MRLGVKADSAGSSPPRCEQTAALALIERPPVLDGQIHHRQCAALPAGEPLSCTARVLQGGHDITRADARWVKDNVGLVAGDCVFAQFAFARGVNATFTSDAKLRESECSGRNAARAVEMVMGVYRAALGGGRVTFPLAQRGHPLAVG